jgi:hypothetical protein
VALAYLQVGRQPVCSQPAASLGTLLASHSEQGGLTSFRAA